MEAFFHAILIIAVQDDEVVVARQISAYPGVDAQNFADFDPCRINTTACRQRSQSFQDELIEAVGRFCAAFDL